MEVDPTDPTELLRWWHQYQAQMLNQETDLIRNGLLQEMFALRRRLEVSGQTQAHGTDPTCEVHLAELKRLYALLENICDRLESPFLQDSLPLALQHAIHPWQEQLPLQATLPQTWEAEPVEHTRLLILFLQRLFQQMVAAPDLPKHCELRLEHTAESKQLILKAAYVDSVSLTFMESLLSVLTPFIKTFQLFTQGAYQQEIQDHSLALVLSWKP